MINTIILFILVAPVVILLTGVLLLIELIYGKQNDDV